ncbi:ABC transporter substrate-binding protein [Nocardioides sp.]|uniref:ABC transporter substrate-binding protein n=1 Tax=Nocardioides sp. TaxID=35761 RepID=UPI0035124661
MMRRTTRLVAGSLALGLALSACGGSDDNEGSDGPGENSGLQTGGDLGDAQDPTRQGPVTIEGAQTGGTVKMISVTPLETMDPSESYYVHTASLLSGLVTRSLTQYVYDPETKGVTLVPDLATDTGRPNEDFTEWTFTLRDGIKYEDGTPVTPEDIKFGLERTMDISTFPESPGFYSKDYYEGGADYEGPYTGKGAELDSIKVDGMDITITMAKPFPDMAYWAAFPANGPIPAGAKSDPAKYKLHPLATGPYMFEDYTPGEKLTLVRNPNWDPATDPGRTAYPDRWEFDYTVPSEKVDQILLNDEGDAKNTFTMDDIQGSNYRAFTENASDRLVVGGTPCTRYWAPDYRQITDIRVRQAIGYAFPYKAAIKAAGLIEGVNRAPGSNLMPPGTPGRTEYEPLPGVSVGETDPAKARELLAEAGEEGYELRFFFISDDPAAVATKDAIVKGLEEGGFTAKPIPTTLANATADREDPDAPVNVRSAGWCSDWPSGGSWFPPLLKTEDLEAQGQISQNYAVFSEQDVDDRIASIQELPIEEQPAAWDELDKYIHDTYYPLIVTGYDGVIQTHGSNVNGHYDDPVFGMPTFKSIWLTQS